MTSLHSSVVPGSRDRLGNDPIFALNAEAARRRVAGESILNATLGALMDDEGRLCTLPTVIETMARVQERTAGYAPISGLPAFRAAVLDDLFTGTELAARAVAVSTPGGTGAVYEAVQNFLERGQQMLAPSFFWGPYRAIAAHTGRSIDTFPMFTSDGAFDVDALAAGLDTHLERQGRALLVLNFPCHNPTGYSLDDAEWARVAEVVTAAGHRAPVTVLIDAAYMDFGGELARSWVQAVPALMEAATVLVAWTASKSLAQYGARVGALVGLHRDPSELSQIDNALGYSCRATWSNCNHAGQVGVTELLTDDALRARVGAERSGLLTLLRDRIEVFNRHADAAGIPTPRYDAGFFVSVLTPDEERSAARMRELGVYGVPVPGGIRIALCSTPAAAIPRLVEAIEAGVAAGAT